MIRENEDRSQQKEDNNHQVDLQRTVAFCSPVGTEIVFVQTHKNFLEAKHFPLGQEKLFSAAPMQCSNSSLAAAS